MSETTVESPLADLTTLQKQLEDLAARIKSNDGHKENRQDNPKPMLITWGR